MDMDKLDEIYAEARQKAIQADKRVWGGPNGMGTSYITGVDMGSPDGDRSVIVYGGGVGGGKTLKQMQDVEHALYGKPLGVYGKSPGTAAMERQIEATDRALASAIDRPAIYYPDTGEIKTMPMGDNSAGLGALREMREMLERKVYEAMSPPYPFPPPPISAAERAANDRQARKEAEHWRERARLAEKANAELSLRLADLQAGIAEAARAATPKPPSQHAPLHRAIGRAANSLPDPQVPNQVYWERLP